MRERQVVIVALIALPFVASPAPALPPPLRPGNTRLISESIKFEPDRIVVLTLALENDESKPTSGSVWIDLPREFTFLSAGAESSAHYDFFVTVDERYIWQFERIDPLARVLVQLRIRPPVTPMDLCFQGTSSGFPETTMRDNVVILPAASLSNVLR